MKLIRFFKSIRCKQNVHATDTDTDIANDNDMTERKHPKVNQILERARHLAVKKWESGFWLHDVLFSAKLRYIHHTFMLKQRLLLVWLYVSDKWCRHCETGLTPMWY